MTIVEAQVAALREYIVDFMKINQKVFDAADYHQNKQNIIEFMAKKNLLIGLLDQYVDPNAFLAPDIQSDRTYLDVLIDIEISRIVVTDR